MSDYGIEIETPGLRRTPRGLRRTLQLGKGRLRGLKCPKVSERKNLRCLQLILIAYSLTRLERELKESREAKKRRKEEAKREAEAREARETKEARELSDKFARM